MPKDPLAIAVRFGRLVNSRKNGHGSMQIAGFAVSALGLIFSFRFDLPTASTITVCFGVLFIAAIVIGGKTSRFKSGTARIPGTTRSGR